ncbi:MAG: hypothetical protein K0R38_3697 [Polyangiaceae bacterium]|nr:hypothetical protein [Polyangiaceae bacterium]
MSARHALLGFVPSLWASSAFAQLPATPAAEPDSPAVVAAPVAVAPVAVAPAAATAPGGVSTPASATAPPDESFTSTDPSSSGVLAEEGPKLELYGFADFSYLHAFGSKQNVIKEYVAPYPRFYVGHLNLYLSSSLGDNWRSLAEVRFTYAPQGDSNSQNSDGTFQVINTNAVDYAELQREFSWGGIELQRAWLEYQPFDFLSIRAGQWLTPYGYWNDDHGSPTIITVHKPFPIGDQFFPERQTGLVAHGKYFAGPTGLGYLLTLSNGRGPMDAFRDLDNNKAIGGRLYLETSEFGNLTVGVAAYKGRYTASTRRYRIDTSGDSPVAVIYRSKDTVYDELSLGADVRWLWNGLHVQGEAMMNEATYDDRYRPPAFGFDPRPSFAADYRRWGGYLLVGYRTRFFGVMPYAMGEFSSYSNTDLAPPSWAWSGGINLRPTPNVVLKAELAIATFQGLGSTGLGAQDLPYFGTQAAWAF